MSYKSKSIKEMVSDIETAKVYLPALQRKFVWNRPQIEMLFDSIMRNYPIGTFLFWKLNSEIANTYVFYEFLKEYDQRNPYNRRKTGAFMHTEITGVLDGQQRLSSLYLGLQGTHTEKVPYMRWADENAYKKNSLYLNLLSLPFQVSGNDDIELIENQNFEFRFLTEEDSTRWTQRTSRYINEDGTEVVKEEIMYWMKVGQVLTWKNQPEFSKILTNFIAAAPTDQHRTALEDNRRFIEWALSTLHQQMAKESLIHYFEVDKEELEDILKIFIRVNSGGTQLSQTDLLFSTIVATWDDGREKIEALLQKINQKGSRFNFSNEFLMRCCLVLSDGPVLFKVNSFKSENVESIKLKWDDIARAVERTVDLLVSFGFDGSLLSSQNAVIPIAYYLLKGGTINDETKSDLKKYLFHALLNQIFGSSQDQLLNVLRNSLRKPGPGTDQFTLKNDNFSFSELLAVELPSRKTLYISETELDNFMTYKKGSASFLVLALLYPHLKYSEIHFHQDHIHPASGFTDNVRLELGIPENSWKIWLDQKDMVPNLQIMEARQNESKNDSAFESWLSGKKSEYQENFKITNYIPANCSLTFTNFETFFTKRKEKLKEELRRVLAINTAIQLSNDDFLAQAEVTEG